MKKKLIIIVSIVVLVCSIGVARAMATGFVMKPRGPGALVGDEAKFRKHGEALTANGEAPVTEGQARERRMTPPCKNGGMSCDNGGTPCENDEGSKECLKECPKGFPGMSRGFRGNISDEDRQRMEAAVTEHKEKLEAFIASLSDEQKALFESIAPKIEKPADGQFPSRPDGSELKSIKEKYDAFVASLSEAQKAAYDELFRAGGFGFGMPGAKGAAGEFGQRWFLRDQDESDENPGPRPFKRPELTEEEKSRLDEMFAGREGSFKKTLSRV